MNDVRIITDKILETAKAEADKIISDAEAAAQVILADADKKVLAISEKAAADAKAEAENICAKEISAAKMASGKRILAEKQAIIDEVVKEAYNRLLNLSDNSYKKAVSTMLKSIPQGECEIIVAEKDRAILESTIIEAGLRLSDETRDIDGGFIVKCKDVEYNYTFASILSIEQEEIRSLAAQMLFR